MTLRIVSEPLANSRDRTCARGRCTSFARAVKNKPRRRVVAFCHVGSTNECSTGYIGEFEVVDDHRSGKIVVELIGRLNKCGVISPRFDIQLSQLEKWCNMLLPSRQFGFLVMTTSYGILDHEEAKRKHTGGKILGFFY